MLASRGRSLLPELKERALPETKAGVSLASSLALNNKSISNLHLPLPLIPSSTLYRDSSSTPTSFPTGQARLALLTSRASSAFSVGRQKQPPVLATKNISRHCQIPPGEPKSPLPENQWYRSWSWPSFKESVQQPMRSRPVALQDH